MKSIAISIVFVLLLAPLCLGQSTAVTLQVTDTDAQTWNNGTWSVQLISETTSQGPFVIAGTSTPVPNQSQSGALSATGGASMTLTPNASIAPANTEWAFQVCPQANPSPCFYIDEVIIQGASQTVTLTPPGIRINIVNPTVVVSAYQDLEIVGQGVGSVYYNLTSSAARQWNGIVWSPIGGQAVGPDPNNTPECATSIAASGITGQVNISPAVKWLNTGVLHGAICVTTTGATVPIGVLFNIVQANNCCHLDLWAAGSGKGVRVLDPLTQSPNNGGVDLIPSVNGNSTTSLIITGQHEGGSSTEQAISMSQGADGNALYQFGLNSPNAVTANLQALTYGTGQSTNTDGAGTITASSSTATQTWANTHYTVHPICTVSDETTVTSAVKVTYNTTVSVTFTTPGAVDVIDYLCAPRN